MSRSVKQNYEKLRELQAEGKVIVEAKPLSEAGADVIDILSRLIPRVVDGISRKKEAA